MSTGVIFANFSKGRNIYYAIESFRLLKIKSTNKSELFLISLVGISESCVASFNRRFKFLLKYLFCDEWETEFGISTRFFDCNNTRMIPVFNNVKMDLLNVLWNLKISDSAREEIIQHFCFS